MPIILYGSRMPSPSVRAVETVIRIIKLDVERREVNVISRENIEPWFVELSPAREVPVLDDDGYILTDRFFPRDTLQQHFKNLYIGMLFFSHAIIAYLLTVYAPEDILEQYYPTDPKLRGIINSRWYFESGMLFARVKAILLPILLWNEKEVPLEKTRWLLEGVYFLEKLLEGKKWLAGDRLTIADISAITTIDFIELLVPLKYYRNVSAWAKRVRKTSPFYNEVGIDELNEFSARFRANSNYDPEDHWKQIQSSVED